MTQRTLQRAALVGLVAGAAAVLLLLLLRTFAGVSLPAELVADRVLPMIPVNAFLALLGRFGGPIAAKEEAFWGGLAGVIAAALVASLVWARLRRSRWGGRVALGVLGAGSLAALLLLAPVLRANYAGLSPTVGTVAAALGSLAAVATAAALITVLQASGRPVDRGRRNLLLAGAGAAMLAAAGGLGVRLFAAGTFAYDGTRLLGPERRPVTPAADFYIVTKNLVDPDVEPALWRLEVAGAVARPFSLTLGQLGSIDASTQETTLECISNGVAYGLLSNGEWTGAPLASLLERAGPSATATTVELLGVDGYVYALPIDRAVRGDVLIAYRLNGAPLDRRHGAPARAVVPGAYGEASAKWLTRITVLTHDEDGYYASQGWRAGFVRTTSVIDQPARGQRLPAGVPATIRGVAFAGDRGVSRVEVSADGGATWSVARIDYSRSPLAWALWSASWTPAVRGAATLIVRAYDGGGALQEQVAHGFAPSGAAGLHHVEVSIV